MKEKKQQPEAETEKREKEKREKTLQKTFSSHFGLAPRKSDLFSFLSSCLGNSCRFSI